MFYKNKFNIKSVFVLGSSSEVAKQICIKLAKKGCTRFHLLTRDLNNNKELINTLKKYNIPNLTQEIFDLNEETKEIPNVDQFDLYLITAGRLGDSELARNDLLEANKILNVNYGGLLRWLTAIATTERFNTKSKLWIFSSVAGDVGRPSNYHYGAAKAALTCFCNGLFLRAYRKPFSIRIFKAGYIYTRMSIGKAPKILCISPSKLAKIVLSNPNKRGIEYLPWWWSIIIKIVQIVPTSIKSKL